MSTTAHPAPRSHAPRSRVAHWTLLGIVLVGATLRFSDLTKESFWLDEGYVVQVVDQPTVADVVREASRDVHPPLHFVLLWAWMRVFGGSDAAIRAFSALVATAAIPAAWALARRLVAPRAALVATAIVALSPLLLRHAHDAKQYSLLLLLATVSTERFLAYFQGGRTSALVGWAVATALLAYTHFIGVTSVLAQDALLLVGVPRAARPGRAILVPWAVAHVAVALAAMPWLPYLYDAAPRFQGFPGSQRIHALWRAVVDVAGTARGVAVLFGLAAVGLVLCRRRGHALPPGLSAACVLAGVPLVLPWVASALTFPSFVPRLVIHAVPPLAVAAGAGLVHLLPNPRRALALALPVAVVALGLVRLHPRIEREQWREASALIAAEAGPRDQVVALQRVDATLLRRYMPRGGPVVREGRAGLPAPSAERARLFVVKSVHTLDLDAWRRALLALGWHEARESNLVMVTVLRFEP